MTPDRYREDADPRLAEPGPSPEEYWDYGPPPGYVPPESLYRGCRDCGMWNKHECRCLPDVHPPISYGPVVKLPDYYDHQEQADVDAEDARREER